MDTPRRWPLYSIAFLSGIPALMGQVVWTRQVALAAGSESEAMGLVVALFFAGLAAGSAVLGRLADRSVSPLRLYALLEGSAGGVLLGVALLSLSHSLAEVGASIGLSRRVGAVLPILPVTFLMGGTLPALLRHALNQRTGGPSTNAGTDAGRLVALNTGGAVVGVGLSLMSIPAIGLRASLLGAGSLSGIVAAASIVVSTRTRGRVAQGPQSAGVTSQFASPATLPASMLRPALVAGLAGMATLSFEVSLGRSTALALGSSLYAWGAVLALTLMGLAAGNALGARRLEGDADLPLRLARTTILAAAAMLLTPLVLGHHPAEAAHGLGAGALIRTTCAVVPAMFLMGVAFPSYVKWGVSESHRGRDFGWIAAINTAGGVVGSIAAGFWILPLLGPRRAFAACAAMAVTAGMVAATAGMREGRLRRLAPVCMVLVVGVGLAQTDRVDEHLAASVISIDHGRRATTVVLRTPRSRELIVDGEPEASTYGSARRTEQLLAVLPFVMHPDPQRFLELGLGSGITLATASLFSPGRIDVVEIAPSVIRAQRFFAPDNGAQTGGAQSRARIVVADARNHLRAVGPIYDIVVANTAQPWSLQSTGLYSVEYYRRVRGALREGGIAAQWLPYERISSESLSEILNTFFFVFEEGGMWWGDGSLLLLGSMARLPSLEPERIRARLDRAGLLASDLGLQSGASVALRHLATARTMREKLIGTAILTDDRPRLEGRRTLNPVGLGAPPALAILRGLVEAQRATDSNHTPIATFIESLWLRSVGEVEKAERLENNLSVMGLALGDAARRERGFQRIDAALGRSDSTAAGRLLDEFPESDRIDYRYSMARAFLAMEANDDSRATRALREASRRAPHDPVAPSLLGEILAKTDLEAGQRSFDEALRRDPFSVRALAASGLIALAIGEDSLALDRLEELGQISPLGERPETRALRMAIDRGSRSADAAADTGAAAGNRNGKQGGTAAVE